jgi:hypothetical protein
MLVGFVFFAIRSNQRDSPSDDLRWAHDNVLLFGSEFRKMSVSHVRL